MAKANKWMNWGDVNPREYGGIFIKYSKENKEYAILKTTPMENPDGFDYSYLIEYAVVKRSTLLRDDICTNTGLERKVENIIGLAIAWISYYGSYEEPYVVTNYWEELKKYGIYPDKFKKIMKE